VSNYEMEMLKHKMGCGNKLFGGAGYDMCYCDTNLCNGATVLRRQASSLMATLIPVVTLYWPRLSLVLSSVTGLTLRPSCDTR